MKDDLKWRKWIVLELVRKGKLSSGKAAEILEMTKWDFMELTSSYDIPMANFPAEELEIQAKGRGLIWGMKDYTDYANNCVRQKLNKYHVFCLPEKVNFNILKGLFEGSADHPSIWVFILYAFCSGVLIPLDDPSHSADAFRDKKA